MDNIGVFGGSFDPVHAGHLAAARAFQSQFGLTRVHIVPSPGAPLKTGGPALAGDARLKLLQAAFAPWPDFVCDEIELSVPAPAFTVDTLKKLRASRSAQWHLLIGEDQLSQLPKWRNWHELFELATVAVAPRRGCPRAPLPDGYDSRVVRLKMEPVDLSSTEIREDLAAGRNVFGRVPEAALAIIRQKGYYGVRAGA